MSRRISRRAARSTVIQPRGGAWSGRTISSRSPSRHHYRSPPDSHSSPRRLSPTACLGDARLFPAQLSSRISLSPSRRKRPAVIRAKESARAPAPPPRTCDSASTMQRRARKLRFRREEAGRLVRVAHLFVHRLAANRHFTGWIDTGRHRGICNLREPRVRKSPTPTARRAQKGRSRQRAATRFPRR